jgi:hypothetical protein
MSIFDFFTTALLAILFAIVCIFSSVEKQNKSPQAGEINTHKNTFLFCKFPVNQEVTQHE